ncbi:hypothetical protein [Brevibacillus porteri]|uniref:hypothetical protein n=1 Tax=Brevibacillus porteri TaxID=2126350 RepID=UPI003D1FA947
MKLINPKPISQIRAEERLLAEKDELILQMDAANKELQQKVNQLTGEKATLEAQVVQVNADLMGFMEYYFKNTP